MKLTIQKVLFDALTACELIAEFVAGCNFADYEKNAMLRSAVEHQFEIVGEALNQARYSDETIVTLLPDLPRIVGLRNRLIHGYATINNQIIWSIVVDDIPVLTAQLQKLLT